MRVFQFLFISILMMLTLASGKADNLSPMVVGAGVPSFSWAGYYSQQSEFCTDPSFGARCSEEFRDYLKIELWNRSYLVELYSTQADQHVCSFSFLMDAVDGELVYRTEFGRVLIHRNAESLEITSNGVDPTALGLGVCGAHADIDGLKFPLVSKCSSGCKK